MTYLLEEEPERHAVRPARFRLEMEDVDEHIRLQDVALLLGYSLSHDVRIVVDADDRIGAVQLPEELVVARFVDADPPTFLLAGDLSLLDETFNEVLDHATLRYQNIIVILLRVLVA